MRKIITSILQTIALLIVACVIASCSFDSFLERIKLATEREQTCSFIQYLTNHCHKIENTNIKIVGDFNDQTALELLYGKKYDEKSKSVTWELMQPPSGSEFDAFRNKSGTVKVAFSQAFTFNGIAKYYFITKTFPNMNPGDNTRFNCHDCAPLIGGAIFVKKGNEWVAEVEEKYIATIGASGAIPSLIYLVDAGKDSLGIMFQGEDTIQGYTTKYVSFVVPYDKSLKEVLSIDIGANNYTICGEKTEHCWGYKSKIILNKDAESPYYDIEIFVRGSYLNDNGKINPLNEIESYHFSDGEYKEQD